MAQKKAMAKAVAVLIILILSTAVGCGKKGEEVPLQESSSREEMPLPPLPDRIDVPGDVAAKWQSVVLELTNKEISESTDQTVGIGETVPLGDTGLTVSVEAFLPAFRMTEGVYTSSSADPTNPAAKVKVLEDSGSVVFDGWLFGLYPATHPFEHEKYALTLKGYVARP